LPGSESWPLIFGLHLCSCFRKQDNCCNTTDWFNACHCCQYLTLILTTAWSRVAFPFPLFKWGIKAQKEENIQDDMAGKLQRGESMSPRCQGLYPTYYDGQFLPVITKLFTNFHWYTVPTSAKWTRMYASLHLLQRYIRISLHNTHIQYIFRSEASVAKGV
jgi:hypothetical protein